MKTKEPTDWDGHRPATQQRTYERILAGKPVSKRDKQTLRADQNRALANALKERFVNDAAFFADLGMWGWTRKAQKHEDSTRGKKRLPTEQKGSTKPLESFK